MKMMVLASLAFLAAVLLLTQPQRHFPEPPRIDVVVASDIWEFHWKSVVFQYYQTPHNPRVLEKVVLIPFEGKHRIIVRSNPRDSVDLKLWSRRFVQWMSLSPAGPRRYNTRDVRRIA